MRGRCGCTAARADLAGVDAVGDGWEDGCVGDGVDDLYGGVCDCENGCGDVGARDGVGDGDGVPNEWSEEAGEEAAEGVRDGGSGSWSGVDGQDGSGVDGQEGSPPVRRRA